MTSVPEQTPRSSILSRFSLMWAVIVWGIFAGITSGPAQADRTLIFGTYTADKPTETVRKYAMFLSFLEVRLSDQLGEPVSIRMKIDKDYDAAIHNLANGTVDFARFGPASYVTAKELDPDLRIVAIEANKGTKRFKGVIAIHQDSQLRDLSDLKGYSFGFGDELSTIGRYLAQSHLIYSGITSSDLSNFAYLGRHDIVGEAVGSGRFTAGALKESTFKKLVAKGVPIKSLMTFDNVTKPWLASSSLSSEISDLISQIMLDPANRTAMQGVAKHGFLQGTDADYELIRQAMTHSLSF